MNDERAARLTTLLAAATASLVMLTVIFVPVLPGQDIPPHTLAALVLSQPDAFADYFEVNWALTAQLFEAITVGLLTFLPLFWAAKAAYAVAAASLIAGCGVLARRAGASPGLAVSLAAAFCLGWPFAMGFVNFFSGLATGVVGVALIATKRPTLKVRAVAATVFLIAAFGHIVAAGLMGVFSLVVRAVITPRESRVRELALDVATWIPAGALTLVQMIGTISADTASGRRDVVADTVMPSGVPYLLEGAFGGFSSAGWLIPLALGAALVAVDRNRRSATVLVALAAFMALMALMPLHAIGWHFAKPRPMFFAAVALPSLLIFGSPRGRLVPPVIAALCLAVTALNAVGTARESIQIATWIANYGASPSGRTFEVNFHPEPAGPSGPGIQAAIGVPHYATRYGGATPGAFATNPNMHSLSFPGGPDRFFPATPLLAMIVPAECRHDAACYRGDHYRADVVATMLVDWDTAALVDPPSGVTERLRERGMTELAPWLWASESADIRAELPPGFRGPIAWQLGYLDTVGVISSGAADITADGMVLRVTDIPGGPTLVRIHRDPNGDGQHQEGELVLLLETVSLRTTGPTTVQIPQPTD